MEGRKMPFHVVFNAPERVGIEQFEFTGIIIPTGGLKGWYAVRTLQTRWTIARYSLA